MPTKILIPGGVLGLGFSQTALERGVDMRPDAIAIDGGSTDSGPYYLGSGESKYSTNATTAEWRRLMQARHEAGVPLIIGSCGTCGVDRQVDKMLKITEQIAKDTKQNIKVATIYSQQSIETLHQAHNDGRITNLDPHITLTKDGISSLSNVVALAGVEQISAALDAGADIVLAGRTTDTALIAALPIRRGEHVGAAWHGAKLTECGALCSTQPTSGVVMATFDRKSCTIEALADEATCTSETVSAHMLYENADPFRLHEPGGTLDVTKALYESIGNGRVRVTGSLWHPNKNYTVKLEGSRLVGYQTMTIAMVRTPRYVKHIDRWADKLVTFLKGEITSRMALAPESYSLGIRLIGKNATLGQLENAVGNPVEIGVMIMINAPSQEQANEIARLINPFLLHFPLSETEELPTFAFPYSPAESPRGPVYSFALNHVMRLDDPMQGFQLNVHNFSYA